MHSETNEGEESGSGNTYKYMTQLLLQALNSFDDVEVSFLGILRQERIPPRTLAKEYRVLDQAESVLARIAT